MPLMNTELFYAVNHGMQNALFDWLMPNVSRYANWLPVGIAIFGYFIWQDRRKGLSLLALAVVAVSASDFISSHILKGFFVIPRPCIALPDVHLLMGCSHSGSFPSSHAVNSSAIAAVIGFYDRRFAYISVTSAALVALSRVYVGVHYPFDVAFGALMGFAIGWMALRLSGLKTVAATAPIQ